MFSVFLNQNQSTTRKEPGANSTFEKEEVMMLELLFTFVKMCLIFWIFQIKTFRSVFQKKLHSRISALNAVIYILLPI